MSARLAVEGGTRVVLAVVVGLKSQGRFESFFVVLKSVGSLPESVCKSWYVDADAELVEELEGFIKHLEELRSVGHRPTMCLAAS